MKHRRHHHRRFLGVPRHAVQDRLELGRAAAGMLGALGSTGGARRQQDQSCLCGPSWRGRRPAWAAISFSTVRVVGLRMVGPRDDAGGVGLVGQRTVHRVGELLVVDHRVGAFAVDHLGQRRAGERRVQQQHVGADPVGRDQRLDEAAVVAAHDGQPLPVCRRAAPAAPPPTRRRAGRAHGRSACPSSSISAGRFGQRCADIAKPLVTARPSRRTTAAMRRYLSGRSGCDDSRADHGGQQAERCHRRYATSRSPGGGALWPACRAPSA